MEPFEDFLTELFEAIRHEDKGFIRKVYGDWLFSSGIVPKSQEEIFYDAAFGDLRPLLEGKLERVEEMDDFRIAHYRGPSGGFSLTFREKEGSFIFFNEKSNYSSFHKVYALNYGVQGKGRLRLIFNGRRSPLIADIEGGRSGFNSLINAALAIGTNELTLKSLDKGELEVSLQISSAEKGGIMDSAHGDVLSWSGKVADEVRLRFEAEVFMEGDKEQMLGFFSDAIERNLVGKAYDFAMGVHAGHERDNGDPYFLHPCRVALILLREFGINDAALIAAALLHDVLEMSDVTREELVRDFGETTAALVDSVSKPGQRTPGWEERYYSGIKAAGHDAQLLKFADRLDNIRDLRNATEEKRERYLKATKERFLPWMKEVDQEFHQKLSYEIKKLEAPPEHGCRACKDGEEGMASDVREEMDMLAAIEVLMSCGCGGTVRHSFHRCRHCGKHYLSSAYMHREYGSYEDYHLKEVGEKDAREAMTRLKGCPEPDNPCCGCPVHKESEFLDNRINGTLKHSGSLPH